MAGLAFLMISNVPYPAWPTFSLRTFRGAIGLVAFVALLFGLVFLPKDLFFPVGVVYVLYGVVRVVLLGLVDRVGENGHGERADDHPQSSLRPPGPGATAE